MKPPNAEQWVTRHELAAHLSISTASISRLMREGLPCIRYGVCPRFQISVVEGWLAARNGASREWLSAATSSAQIVPISGPTLGREGRFQATKEGVT